MAKRRKPGRRPLAGSPMVRSAFTANVEHIVFLRLYSRNDTVSQGIQFAADLAMDDGKEGRETKKQTDWMIHQAKDVVGEDATQKELYDWIWTQWDSLLHQYKDSKRK